MPLPKLKNLFVTETCLRFFAIDLQSGHNLAQSVKLGV